MAEILWGFFSRWLLILALLTEPSGLYVSLPVLNVFSICRNAFKFDSSPLTSLYILLMMWFLQSRGVEMALQGSHAPMHLKIPLIRSRNRLFSTTELFSIWWRYSSHPPLQYCGKGSNRVKRLLMKGFWSPNCCLSLCYCCSWSRKGAERVSLGMDGLIPIDSVFFFLSGASHGLIQQA